MEGVLTLVVGLFGVILNLFSICFFVRQRTQRTFHRYKCSAVFLLVCRSFHGYFIRMRADELSHQMTVTSVKLIGQ